MFTPARLAGSSLGGSFLKLRSVHVGFRLELGTDRGFIITSPVRDRHRRTAGRRPERHHVNVAAEPGSAGSRSCWRSRCVCAAPAPRPADDPPILILISFDGWRWDYIDRQPAPHLRALAARGVRATAMIPSFPVLTFPNHYTIVTGLYPEHHGIVGNTMRDAVDARAIHPVVGDGQGRSLVGRRAGVGHRDPPGTARSDDVLAGYGSGDWRRPADLLEAVRQDVRHARSRRAGARPGWRCPPRSGRRSSASTSRRSIPPDTTSAPTRRSSPRRPLTSTTRLGALVAGVHRLGLDNRTSIVVISDHGMTPMSYDRVIYLDALIDLSTVDVLEYGSTLQLNPRDGDVDGLYRRLHGKHPKLAIYKRKDVPKRLHFSDNPRIPAIVGVPADGWVATSGQRLVTEELHVGAHGYEPTTPRHGRAVRRRRPAAAARPRRRAVRERARLRSALPDSGDHAGDATTAGPRSRADSCAR